MGLDIFLLTTDYEELLSEDYFEDVNNILNQHRLSRTFCNFMLRRNSYGESELDQIGRMAGVNISPLKDMEKNWEENDIAHQLSFTQSETEREAISKKLQADKDNLKYNIDQVLKTINLLLNNLSQIDNIALKLDGGRKDTLGYDSYFSNFNTNRSDKDNFGQDLRNFKRFLEFAKSNGRRSVWFYYG